ncbi:SDR family NAD(P)-dependent oxidoreductase [Xanthomonas euvesicatoria]|uniref:SDR family NAD(P)-dependent oxidoreductase n=1 Tax=Xanthomonas euvesicatoria TaxID=456327 RepID=UPI001C4368E3|nr:SDR family oxidoreductase [Xanthomonas euvesicatoria]MBV6896580.1 SDR family oxidoreductase [Xanthomonas campestris pv. ionidii]
MNLDWAAGKTLLITGGSKGIGGAMVEMFSASGGASYILSRNSLSPKAGTTHIGMDIMSSDSMQRGISALKSKIDSVDYIVLNAGFRELRSLTESDSAHWSNIYQANLFSAVYITREMLPFLRRGGAIVTVSSSAPRQCHVNTSAYASSQVALEIYSRVISRELALLGIRVNTVAPGPTRTDGLMNSFSEETTVESISKSIPMRRIGEASEVASCILYLLSPQSSFITGQVIHCNGGL